MASWDLTVRGAGVFGLAVAWAAARRGARVRVVDPGGVGAGASGGLVGALAPHAPDGWTALKAFQFESLAMAPDWWAAVGAASGLATGFARTGRLQPLADARAVAAAAARGDEAARRWQGVAAWRLRPAADLEPVAGALLPLSPSGLLVEDTLSARLHPRRALAALAAAITALHGRILPEAEAGAEPVIWATGWQGLAATGLGGGVRGQALALACDAGGAPQIYAPGLHVVPHADGTVAVGSTTEAEWTDTSSTDDRLDALLARAVALCPGLAGAPVVARWAGVRPRAAHRMPLLGPLPGRRGAFVANGGFRIGFGLAPLAGERMADLVLDGAAAIPDAFDPAAAAQPPEGPRP
jgi:glycine/D-amino acid oxidase-like deaminating enzyme